MVKGIIETIESPYLYKVRIPIYHKVPNTPAFTPVEDLPIATVCTSPGVSPVYIVGDIVWIDFENDEIGMPVITGLLYREEQTNATSNINCSTLVVENDTTLSSDTSIGTTGSISLQSLPQIIDSVSNLNRSKEIDVVELDNLPLKSIVNPSSTYPEIAVDDVGKTLFGKIKKFLSDLLSNKINYTDSLTLTQIETSQDLSNKVTSAQAGKDLDDKIDEFSYTVLENIQ